MTGNGSGGREIFDLDAAAKAASADAEPFPFTWKGKRYELPPQAGWELDALAALGRGDLDAALNELLGDDAAELRRSGLTVGAMNALFNAAAETAGLGGLPNSPPPPRPASTRTSKR